MTFSRKGTKPVLLTSEKKESLFSGPLLVGGKDWGVLSVRGRGKRRKEILSGTSTPKGNKTAEPPARKCYTTFLVQTSIIEDGEGKQKIRGKASS